MPLSIWEEISKRPQFIPLPIPKEKKDNEGNLKYEDFEDAKYASKSHGLITSYSANTHQGI